MLGTCIEPYNIMKSTIMSDDDVLRLIVTKKKLNVKELTTEDKLHRADLLCNQLNIAIVKAVNMFTKNESLIRNVTMLSMGKSRV